MVNEAGMRGEGRFLEVAGKLGRGEDVRRSDVRTRREDGMCQR